MVQLRRAWAKVGRAMIPAGIGRRDAQKPLMTHHQHALVSGRTYNTRNGASTTYGTIAFFLSTTIYSET